MSFVTFHCDDQAKVGVLLDDGKRVVDLQNAQQQMQGIVTIPDTMLECIEQGEKFISTSKEIVEWISEHPGDWIYSLEEGQAKLLAPIPRPSKNVFCIGKNYVAHALEIGTAEDIPEYPMVFSKAPTSVTGPDSDVLSHQEITKNLDYEGELAIIISKKGFRISKDDAFDYVFGYTILNDITARDIQKKHKQFLLGKSLDTTCPMGPAIIEKSAIINPHNLHIQTKVNGEVRQDGNTNDFIFDIPTLISVLSQGITLEAGDIISTGTPAGVGHGFNPPIYLKPGDIVEVEIEGIGKLKNTIID